jgi:signal transduction histidine kinase
MKPGPWQWLKTFPGLLAAPRPDPVRQAELIVSVQRRIVLPVKAGVLAFVLYYVFSAGWLNGPLDSKTVILQILRDYFLVYVFCNVVAGVIFSSWAHFPPELFQWLVFVLGILDGLFVAALMVYTGGWQSIAFWLFPILIVLNAVSIPLAMPQIVLNLLLVAFYAGVPILSANMDSDTINIEYVPGVSPPHPIVQTNTVATSAHTEPEKTHKPTIVWDSSLRQSDEQAPTQSFLLGLFVLLLLTLCCYWVQALAERQRRELEEAREFAMREGQLHSAGRLAAEFAHQIKNPLAVITNAAYSLQRSLRENKNSAAQQIEIIQEEVSRADRLVTQIMGYAQLSEGRVEKLDVIEELERAITQVFPPAVPTEIKIHREYADYFPPLLMQRGHLSEIFLNLLKNAREAIGQTGNIFISATCRKGNAIEVSLRDDGPGIPPDKVMRIFEAYYTTKTGGTGLGLAIVKHNTELYDGTVSVKSETGKGAEFILTFPARAMVNIRK